MERIITIETLESLRSYLNDLIYSSLSVVDVPYKNIYGGTEIACSFLEGLKSLGYKNNQINKILEKNYKFLEFYYNNSEIFVKARLNDVDEYFTLECDNDFIKACIEDPKYVHKLDELFDYVKKFLNKMIDKSD